MSGELSDKVVVLTGGGDGIGAECALAYAREGATVAILDQNLQSAEDVASRAGERCIALRVDVAEGAMIESAMTQVLNRFGRIDAVHNNAGVANPSLPLHETSEAEWDDLF